MELKEFIKESLVQISMGIEEANTGLKGTSAEVNPSNIMAYSENAQAYGRISSSLSDEDPIVHLINFDVAIQVQEGTSKGGGLKLSIASIGVGADAQSKNTHSTESRLRFKIPMVYPAKKE